MVSLDCNYSQWVQYIRALPDSNPTTPLKLPNELACSIRVGSDSDHGEVYLYTSGCPIVIKVIPINNGFIKYVEKEVQITTKLSQTSNPWYPKVIGSGKCDITKFHPASKFQKHHILQDQATLGMYIGLELLDMDLSTYLKEFNPTRLASIVKDILYILYDLNITQKISHNDLHLRNIMLRGDQFVIIDFGSATNYTDHDLFGDAITFLNEFYQAKPLPWIPKLREKMEKMDSFDLEKVLALVDKYKN